MEGNHSDDDAPTLMMGSVTEELFSKPANDDDALDQFLEGMAASGGATGSGGHVDAVPEDPTIPAVISSSMNCKVPFSVLHSPVPAASDAAHLPELLQPPALHAQVTRGAPTEPAPQATEFVTEIAKSAAPAAEPLTAVKPMAPAMELAASGMGSDARKKFNIKRGTTERFDLDLDDNFHNPSEGCLETEVNTEVVLVSTNCSTAPDISITKSCVSVGRHQDADVVLSDSRVSAEQFVIRRKSGSVCEFEDRSSNGTLVNKRAIKSAVVQLHDRDLIEVLPASKVGHVASIMFLVQMFFPEGKAEEATKAMTPPSKRCRLTTPAGEGHPSDADLMFEGAMCVFCQEVIHRATSVHPCLHSFCSSCLGRWMGRLGASVKQCPLCRKDITGVTRNHGMSGLIEGLLKVHPERLRPAEQLAELDTNDMLLAADYNIHRLRHKGGPRCASAPPVVPLPPGSDHHDDSTTSDYDHHDDDSAEDHSSSEESPPREPCAHCHSPSWHNLKEAANILASGHSARELVQNAFGNNNFEADVLQEWLVVHGGSLLVAIQRVLVEPNPEGAPLVEVFGSPPAFPAGSWEEVLVCRSCAATFVASIVYSIRQRIPDGELPVRARGRSDCWFGRNCRTVRHNVSHAQRLNHICPQIRF